MPGAILQLATSRGIVLGISLGTAPILGRLFPPAAYGALNVLTTLVSVLAAFTSLSYVSAIPVAADPAERRDLCTLCFILMIVTTAIIAVISILGGDLLADAFHEPDVAKYAHFLPLLLLATAARQLIDTTLGCQRRFGVVAARNVLESIVTRVVQFGGYFAGLLGSPLALILGVLSGGYVSAAAATSTSVRTLYGEARTPQRIAGVLAAASKHRKFPLIQLWSQTINAVTVGLPALILGWRFSVEVVGLYGMGFTLIVLPLTLFSTGASQVFYVEAAERIGRGQSAAGPTQQLVRVMAILTSFPLVVVLLLGPLLFEVFLGSRWYEAGIYAQILFPWTALVVFAGPLSTLFAAFDRQGESFFWNVALLAARFSTIYFGGMFLGIRATLGLFVAGSVAIIAGMLIRTFGLLGVSRRWVATVVFRAYVEPFLLLAPAGVLYWWFQTEIGAMVALALACAAHATFLHLCYPQILGRVLSRVIGPWPLRAKGRRNRD